MLLWLAGCAAERELVATGYIEETSIRWVRGIKADCWGQKSPLGCADTGPQPCVITMREDAPDWVVAEEFRHCFGYVHKKERHENGRF